MTLAAIRPSDVEFPLFVHVFGAMVLIGTLLVVATALLLAWRRTEPGEVTALTRFGLRWLLIGVLPSFVVMRIGAQWTESASDYPESFEPSWLEIGFITADLGAVLILISIVLAAVGLWRLRKLASGLVFGRIVGVVTVLLLAAYLVAMWAMTAKPT